MASLKPRYIVPGGFLKTKKIVTLGTTRKKWSLNHVSNNLQLNKV